MYYETSWSFLRKLIHNCLSCMLLKTIQLCILVGVVLFSGCTDIAEFDDAFSGGLHIISSVDLSTTSTITGIPGARSLLIYPGNIYVASTEGIVYHYDSESLDLIGEAQVGSPSPAGYYPIVLNGGDNSAYLVGTTGNILELSLPDCIVRDVFSVCQFPVALAVAPGNPPYLYVGDGPTNTVSQVSTRSNRLLESVDLQYEVICIEAGWYADSLLVGTSGPAFFIEEYGPSNLLVVDASGLSHCQSLASIPNDSNFVAVTRSQVGVVQFISDPVPGEPMIEFVGNIDIQGTNHLVAIGGDWQHAYVLSYIGDFTSRLISYNYVFKQIDQIVEIPGFPLDLKASNSGNIYVLTYE